MPRVAIHTADGETIEVNASAEDEEFYDNLPFTSTNVVATHIRH